jgi:hypothetical protein
MPRLHLGSWVRDCRSAFQGGPLAFRSLRGKTPIVIPSKVRNLSCIDPRERLPGQLLCSSM